MKLGVLKSDVFIFDHWHEIIDVFIIEFLPHDAMLEILLLVV